MPFNQQSNRANPVIRFRSANFFVAAILVLGVVGCDNEKFTPPPTEAEFSVGAFSVPYPSDVFITYAALNEAALVQAGAPGASLTNTPIIPSAEDASDTGDVLIAQGFLDGFSVTMPMQLDFTHNLDPSTVVGGQTVRVFEISISPPSATFAASGAPIAMPTSIIREFQADSDYSVSMSKSVGYQIVVRPRIPWPASDNVSLGGQSRGILVAVTNGVRDFRGNPIIRSDQYDRMANQIDSDTGIESIDAFANSVGAMVGSSLQLLAAQGMNPADIVVSNSFTCQSVNDVIDEAVSDTLDSGPFATTPSIGVPTVDTVAGFLIATGVLTPEQAAGLPTNPNMSQGTITLPTIYPGSADPSTWLSAAQGYLNTDNDSVVYQSTSAAPNPAFPTRYNPDTKFLGTAEVPVTIFTPSSPSSPGPWPTIIFQHGITRSRFDASAVAPLFAAFGFATIAMDAPLHGTSAANPYCTQLGGAASGFGLPGSERSFGMDLINNETGEPGFDGIPDESGTYFLNFPSLISSRAVWTQAVCDLNALATAIPTWDIGDSAGIADGIPDFTGDVYYVGQSLGALIGTTFLSSAEKGLIKGAELNVGGGHVAKLLENSPNYNPRLMAFFEGEGLVQGSTTAEQALNVISSVADGIDPINHVRRAAGNTNLRMSFVAGGNPAENFLVDTAGNTTPLGYFPPDLVVPTDSLGTGFYADYLGYPISGIPTSGSDDNRLYTGIVEPSYLGGGFPMMRMASMPKMKLGNNNFPQGFIPQGGLVYKTGDHGVFADPTSDPGYSMQASISSAFFRLTTLGSDSFRVNIPAGALGNVPKVDILDESDLVISVEAGSTLLGSITVSETGDSNSPIEAVFDTNGESGSLAAAAAAYGAHHFNWYQVVTSDDLPPNAPSGDLNAVGASLSSPRISPPSGGTGQTAIAADNGVYADDKPWLWNEIQVDPSAFSIDQDAELEDFFGVREFTDNVGAPAPAGTNQAVGDPSLQTTLSYDMGPWLGVVDEIAGGSGDRVEVRVWLVAVDVNGDAVRVLRGFTFQVGENNASGSYVSVNSGAAELPGSAGSTGDDGLLGSF
ncbi:MAG: hypothetical protein H8E43_07245 [Planctomycetia bacterium]|nr:hypothetical protein [Planctomycetia bacterium]